MVTQDERTDYLTVAEADRRFNEIDRRLGHIEDRIADLAHGQRSINDRLDKVNDRIDRLDARFAQVDARLAQADEKADRNFNILNNKIDEAVAGLYARIAAGEDALRRENRWLFGILFAMILAIFGMLIRLMV